jgi:DNA-binding transcriptional MerR regulator
LNKGREAFRTISEVAAELDVPKHVLRFWETRFSQLRPMKRGGGRRYYRPEDVDLLRGIRTLLHQDGYTIKGLQRVLRQNGVAYVKNCWRAPEPKPALSEPAKGRDIPDLAGETAEHARRAELQRKEAAKNAASARSAPPKGRQAEANGTENPGKSRLSADQRRVLEAVLGELEDCRKLLAGADGQTGTSA